MPLPEFSSSHVDRFVEKIHSVEEGGERLNVFTLMERIPQEAHEIANEIAELTAGWNPVEIYTAENMASERDHFFAKHAKGEVYNPVFDYSRAKGMDITGAREKLHVLRDRVSDLSGATREERLAKVSLLYKIRDDLATCDLIEGIQANDDETVGRGLKVKYPGVDSALLQFTEEAFDRQLRGEREPSVPALLSDDEKNYLERLKINPEGQAEAFTWALRQYGMLREGGQAHGFRVVVDPKVTAIDVRDKSSQGPTVFIPTDRNEEITGAELCALIAHEIEGHARQAMNGEKLFRVGGGALRKDDETLYEGLAMRLELDFMEKYFGKVNADLDAVYFYIFAVKCAEDGGSFHDIFKDQLERRLRISLALPFDRPLPAMESIDSKAREKCMQKAWRTTYRVMRGHVDTTNPHKFAMAKDLAYLRGYLMDKELVEKGRGHFNEAAVLSSGGLQFLAELKLNEKDLPIPFMNIAPQYVDMLLAKRNGASQEAKEAQ